MNEEAAVGREIGHDDRDLLESHLDGALTPEEAGALSERLAREPELAAALEHAKDSRAIRRAVWASYEPAERDSDAMAAASVAAAMREDRFRRAAGFARRATAAAAAVLLAFAGGWVARGREAPEPASVAQPAGLEDHKFVSSGADGPTFPMTVTDENGNAAPVAARVAGALARPVMRVDQVIPGSGAEQSGIRVGDLVVSVAGAPVGDAPALAAAVAAHGGATKVLLVRDGRVVEVTVDLRQE
jgi:membrane-associated protease RseP (regulator of RpoE activity)